MHGPPILAVQIVNYRSRRYLERCLATLVADLDGSGVDYEINLLENASGEELADLEPRFRACRVFSAPRNLGFGGGHNLLAAETAAPNLLILNPDVELIEPETGKRLLGALAAEESVKVVGPKLVGRSGEAQRYDHARLHGLRAQLALRGGHSYWRETVLRQDAAWVSGAVMLVEHDVFAEIHGFDEKLFLYKEDEDLCLRIRGLGGRVVYDPSIVVRHHGSVVADRREALQVASSYYFEKHALNRPWHRLLRATHELLPYLRL